MDTAFKVVCVGFVVAALVMVLEELFRRKRGEWK